MTAHGTWADERLRVHLAPGDIGPDGYPYAWTRRSASSIRARA